MLLCIILEKIQYLGSKTLQLNIKQRICLQKHMLFAWSTISQNNLNDCKIILHEQILHVWAIIELEYNIEYRIEYRIKTIPKQYMALTRETKPKNVST